MQRNAPWFVWDTPRRFFSMTTFLQVIVSKGSNSTILLAAVRLPAALFSQLGKTCSIVPAVAVNRLAVRSPSQVNGRPSTFLAPRRYVLLPISPKLVSRLLHYHHPQRDQRLGREPFEAVAPCHRLLQVAVVRRIAELATGYAELFLVAIRMALGQQMVFRKGEPVGKGRSTVEPTVAAAVAVAREDFGRVPAKGVGVGGHGQGTSRGSG